MKKHWINVQEHEHQLSLASLRKLKWLLKLRNKKG